MPAGLSGYLLSASFLEGRLGTVDVDVRARRQFAAARQAASALGPSSSLRSMLDAGAAPVVDALGFGPPQDVERVGAVLASTFAAGDERVALIVAPWAEPLDLLSSIGLRQAMLRSARWCALFNGTHLRLVDAALPHSRRFVQFDLDTVADDEGAFAAFAYVMGCLPGSLRSLVEASEQHGAAVCRSLKDGVLSASADVLRALVRPSTSPAALPPLLRAGADDRVPHPVPALRRGARPGACVASRVPRTATASRCSGPSPNGPAVPAGSGRRFARSRAWRTPAAARATCA